MSGSGSDHSADLDGNPPGFRPHCQNGTSTESADPTCLPEHSFLLLAVLTALLWDVIVNGLVLFRFGFRLDGRCMDDGSDRQLNGNGGVLVAGIQSLESGRLVVFVFGGRVKGWREAGRVGFRGGVSLDDGTAIDCGGGG